jgi:transposase-like protein
MDFPIADLLDDDRSRTWILQHFHANDLHCPRCKECAQTYTLYSGTVFAGRHLPPPKVVLLLRGVVQGTSTAQLARELELS